MAQLFQINHIAHFYTNAVLFIHVKGKAVIHAPIHCGHDGDRLSFHQFLDHPQTLLDDRLPVHIRTKENKILRRIVHHLTKRFPIRRGFRLPVQRGVGPLIQFQVFHQFLCPDFIVGNDKTILVRCPCPVDHMAFLRIHTSDHIDWELALFHRAVQLFKFLQLMERCQ